MLSFEFYPSLVLDAGASIHLGISKTGSLHFRSIKHQGGPRLKMMLSLVTTIQMILPGFKFIINRTIAGFQSHPAHLEGDKSLC